MASAPDPHVVRGFLLRRLSSFSFLDPMLEAGKKSILVEFVGLLSGRHHCDGRKGEKHANQIA
jgi:hypothetical protein